MTSCEASNSQPFHTVNSVQFFADQLQLTVDQMTYVGEVVHISAQLSQANAQQRERFEVSPSGYGIHWPLLDLDLTIDGILQSMQQRSQQVEAA